MIEVEGGVGDEGQVAGAILPIGDIGPQHAKVQVQGVNEGELRLGSATCGQQLRVCVVLQAGGEALLRRRNGAGGSGATEKRLRLGEDVRLKGGESGSQAWGVDGAQVGKFSCCAG